MSKPAAKKAKTDSKKADSVSRVSLEAVVENVLCPITSALPVRPVVAEDGHVYERDAIARWLSSKATSPMTNAAIGPHLVDAGHMRTLTRSIIESGAVDDDSAAAWHYESAKAMADGKLAGGTLSVKDHLLRADALSSSTEIKLSLKAVNLKLELEALLKEGADAGIDMVVSVLGGAKTGEAPMTELRKLREGKSIIRIISDTAEFKRLCERKAPGATSAVGWYEGMSVLCGKEYTVLKYEEPEDRERLQAYVIEDDEVEESEHVHFYLPFDACILVAA